MTTNDDGELHEAPSSWSGSSGLIKCVDLHNFMCHSRLTVHFGAKLNFVVGHNGSGKSAILGAIMVCLGGKASHTDRGNSVKQLIKNGCQSAKIVVHLSNSGVNAYHPEIFGDTIIVERVISTTTGSAYRVKDSNGHVKYQKRDIVANILDYFMIDVENPLIVLTQKTAKAFLQKTTPKSMYDLFMEGTYLYRIALDANKVQERLQEAEQLSSVKKQELKLLKQEVKSYIEQLTHLKRRDELEHKLQLLQFEQVWLFVEKLEKKLDEERAQHEKARLKLEKAMAKELEHKSKLDDLEAEFEKVSETSISMEQELELPRSQVESYQQVQRELVQEIEQLERDSRLNETDVAYQRGTVAKLEKKLALERQKMQASELGNQSKKRLKLESVKGHIMDLESQKSTLEREKVELIQQQRTLKDECRFHQEKRESKRRTCSELKDSLRDLNHSQTNKLLVYGAGMPGAIDEIESIDDGNGWSGDRPVGPLGSFVVLRDPRWQLTIESLIGKSLCCFVISDNQDRGKLAEVLRKHKVEAQIYYVDCPPSFFQRLAAGEPAEQFLTVRRALDIRHPLAECALVINHRIEKLILVETHSEADQIMASGPNHGPPENVLACYTVDGFSVGHAGGGYATQVLRRQSQATNKLVSNLTAEMDRQSNILRDAEEELRNLDEELRELQQKLNELAGKIKSNEKCTLDTSAAIREQRRLEDKLSAELSMDQPVDLTELARLKSEAENALHTNESQMAELKKMLEVKMLDKSRLLEKLDGAKRDLESKTSQVAQVREMMDSMIQKRTQLNFDLEYYQRKKAEQSQLLNELGDLMRHKEAELQHRTDESLSACNGSRIEVKHSEGELEKKIVSVEKQLTQEIPPAVDQQQLLAKCEDLQARHVACEAALKQSDRLRLRFRKALDRRRQMWINLRDFLTERVTARFHQHIKRRFNGAIQFDHTRGQIEIRMYTDKDEIAEDDGYRQAVSRTSRSATAFSGGEKSFATISLLLSIWDTMGCPIRCLDEFDVFLDSVNRAVAMNMLIEYAQSLQQPTQFVLITPQSMNNIKNKTGIRIHKLADPERNQSRLNFSAS